MRGGGAVEKLPQECVYVCIYSFERADGGGGSAEIHRLEKMMPPFNYRMSSFTASLTFTSPPPPPSGSFFFRPRCPWCWKFHHTFCACLSRVPGCNPSPLFKSDVFSLSRREACQHLAVRAQKGEALSLKKKKSCRKHGALSEAAVRTNAFSFFF